MVRNRTLRGARSRAQAGSRTHSEIDSPYLGLNDLAGYLAAGQQRWSSDVDHTNLSRIYDIFHIIHS